MQTMALPRAKIAKMEPSPDSGRQGNTMLVAQSTEMESVIFRVQTNRDIMAVLAELVSNQYAFFAEVSRDWKNAW
ncbi:unnamed protein product, partial [Laminaria digitata]